MWLSVAKFTFYYIKYLKNLLLHKLSFPPLSLSIIIIIITIIAIMFVFSSIVLRDYLTDLKRGVTFKRNNFNPSCDPWWYIYQLSTFSADR